MSSSSFIDPSAHLTPLPSSSSTPASASSPTNALKRPTSPPPQPANLPVAAFPFSPFLSSTLSTLDYLLQLFFTLTAATLLYLKHRSTTLLAPITRTYYGHILSVIIHAAIPLPLSPDTVYAPPFPLAGSTNPDDVEMAKDWRSTPEAGGTGLSLYQPVMARRLRKHTLVLDLDETLVHTTDVAIPVFDCRVDIQTRRLSRTFYILKRPYLDTFLLTLSPYYHLIIFTASIRRYADAVIDLIDPLSLIEQRFFRSSCVRDEQGQLVKDLSAIGKGRRRMVIIDNSPCAYSRNEENAIPISTWYDEQGDTQLRELIPVLMALRNVEDVRSVLGRRKKVMAG